MKKVVIIGGGPAGLSAGITLALLKPELKAQILILEKYRYPREKPCGGIITPEGVRLLEQLKFKYSEGISYDTIIFRFNGNRVAIKGRGKGIIVSRYKFDHSLALHAMEMGIKLYDNCEVFSIKEKKDYWDIETRCGKLKTEMIVGADGIKGVTRKILPLKGKVVPLLIERKTDQESETPIFSFFNENDKSGYQWIIPDNGGGSKGYFYYRGKPHKLQMRGTAEHLYSPLNPHWRRGVILAGERIGVDPLLGEGIAPSIEMGIIAAKEIIWSIQRERRDFPTYYQTIYSSFTGKKFRFNTLLSSIIYGKNGKKWIRLLTDKKFQEDLSHLSTYGEIYKHPLIFLSLIFRNLFR